MRHIHELHKDRHKQAKLGMKVGHTEGTEMGHRGLAQSQLQALREESSKILFFDSFYN